MQALKFAFLTFLFALTTTANAETATLNPSRSITISGVVDEKILGSANDLLALAETSDKPIDVLIASPGGVVSYGLYFVQAMKSVQAKGITVRCFVPQLAASMAYVIFVQCSERYTTSYAQLLFHSPRVSGNITLTTQLARQLATGLSQLEVVLLKLIAPNMGITKGSAEWFFENYNDETLFIASDLLEQSPIKWFTILNKIEAPKTFSLYPNVWERAELLKRRNNSEFYYIKSK